MSASPSATAHGGTVTPIGYTGTTATGTAGGTATVRPALSWWNPGNLIPGYEGITTFFQIITDGQFWIRVLEIALGSFLILFGVGSLLGKQVLSGADIASLVKSVK
jgi:hypothetical protein